MKINFIGNFQAGPGGELADQVHLANELQFLGHEVRRVPQDIWKALCDGEHNSDWEDQLPFVDADINIITKWHHFNDAKYIKVLQKIAPVFYWVWDWMDKEDWHMKMAKAADLYLSGELGSATFYHEQGVKFYYFQFDSCNALFPAMAMEEKDKLYDVVFLGSCTNQNNRLDILRKINEKIKIRVYGYDYKEWINQGFDAYPAVYDQEFNKVIAQSRIILGTSANVNCFGYWSNRVGKVLHGAGFLLQWYTPGMENFLFDGAEYFSTAEEAVDKIRFYLKNPDLREQIVMNNILLNRERWTSRYKVKQLSILIDRYIKSDGGKTWILP